MVCIDFFAISEGAARWLPLALAYDQSFHSGLAPSFTPIQCRRTAKERFSDAACDPENVHRDAKSAADDHRTLAKLIELPLVAHLRENGYLPKAKK